ncbi:hypothetical protein BGZ58_008145 [Dissophora ornata]|nr:hypothetical protein BGZ58_008145 [Dissophora ornata]
MAMKDPVRQIRIEYPELERQWSALNRGKESMGLRDSEAFLEKHDILEFGLDDDFVWRYNLSVMIHRIAMPKLDLMKCRKGLKGYARMFRKQLEHDPQVPGKDNDVFWRTYLQMIGLIMALRTQNGIDVSSYHSMELFEDAWALEDMPKQMNGPCPFRVTNTIKNLLRDVAINASKDVLLLCEIYESILKLVIRQIKEQLTELQDPVEMSLVEEITAMRGAELQRYYVKPSRNDQDYTKIVDTPTVDIAGEAYDSSIEGNYDQTRESQPKLTSPSLRPLAPSISPLSAPAATLPSVPPSGANADDNIDATSLDQSKEPQLQSASSSKQLKSPSPPPPISSSTQTSIPPPASPSEQHSSPPLEGHSAPSSPSPPATHKSISPPPKSPALSVTKKRPLSLIDRVSRATGIVSMSAKWDGDSEFEDDGDDIPPIELKKSRKHPPAPASVKETEVTGQKGAPEKKHMNRNGEVSEEGPYTHRGPVPPNTTAQPDVSTRRHLGGEGGNIAVKLSTRKGKMVIEKASPKGKGRAKERKKTQPWTTKEEVRLMKLVPWFLYEASPTSQRQRNIRWAQLKRYDEAHGNVLQRRDQVMLKDKYRQKTDNGRHSDYVNRIQQAKTSSIPRHQFPGDRNNLTS